MKVWTGAVAGIAAPGKDTARADNLVDDDVEFAQVRIVGDERAVLQNHKIAIADSAPSGEDHTPAMRGDNGRPDGNPLVDSDMPGMIPLRENAIDRQAAREADLVFVATPVGALEPALKVGEAIAVGAKAGEQCVVEVTGGFLHATPTLGNGVARFNLVDQAGEGVEGKAALAEYLGMIVPVRALLRAVFASRPETRHST